METEITIFSVMSGLAQKHNAINLSQGFPDYEIDAKLANLLYKSVDDGYNQYADFAGALPLRLIIQKQAKHYLNVDIDPQLEITITPGGTYAIYTALASIIDYGDEVIILEPAYDSYIPAIKNNGGIPIPVVLKAENNFTVDFDVLKKAITTKTKAIIINTPHNPSGTTFSESDFQQLDSLLADTNITLISDEVYQHIVFDNKHHISALNFPNLRERTFAIFSFGKSINATVWKVGYVVAPQNLNNKFRKIHQFIAFSVNTPAQYAIAEYLQDFTKLDNTTLFLEQQRNYFLDLMKETAFTALPASKGSYFQLFSYKAISDLAERQFAEHLTKQYGVAAIPVDAFYTTPQNQKLLRFCFAKKNSTLEAAVERLKNI